LGFTPTVLFFGTDSRQLCARGLILNVEENNVLGRIRGSTRRYRVNRPNKSLQPFELVIHDCWFAARSLASVKPIVRRARGLVPESGSLILASVCSFLSVVAAASRFFVGPNSLSLRLFFIVVVVGYDAGW
jgi:hypothetical protein